MGSVVSAVLLAVHLEIVVLITLHLEIQYLHRWFILYVKLALFSVAVLVAAFIVPAHDAACRINAAGALHQLPRLLP